MAVIIEQPRTGSLGAMLAAVTDTLLGARASLTSVDTGTLDIAQLLHAVHGVVRAAEALRIDLIACGDQAGAPRREGATSVGDWAARHTHRARSEGDREAGLALSLAASAPQTHDALADPALSVAKARVVADAMASLPDSLSSDERASIESHLLSIARKHHVAVPRRAARRSLEAVSAAAGDAQEAAALEEEERQARRASTLWMGPADDAGMVEGRFRIPELEAELLRVALEARMAPRKRLPEEGERVGGDRTLSYPQRLGAAFCDVLAHLPSETLHGGTAATVVVTVDFEALRGDVERAGTTAAGARISPRNIRRLACDARLLPAILGRGGQVLDLGRSQRLFSSAQRTAMALRDGGCVFPGCDRPPSWCEAHHNDPWSQGGTTDVDDGALLCAHHHHVVHDDGWDVRRGSDGVTELIPPIDLDPQRRPRRNHRWRPRRQA